MCLNRKCLFVHALYQSHINFVQIPTLTISPITSVLYLYAWLFMLVDSHNYLAGSQKYHSCKL